MKELTLLELLESGAHFGHKTSKWHPKMKENLYGTRSGIHILDLQKTKEALDKACKMAGDIAAAGGQVLFVGTKKQMRDGVREAAEKAGMPFVTVRWLGGTFTNFRTIQKTVKRLEKLKEDQASPDFNKKYTKKERLLIQREILKTERLISGLLSMKRLPEAIFVLSAHHDAIAIKEAQKSRVKIMAIVDSNTDPSGIDVVIPGNDDSVKATTLFADTLAGAIAHGKSRYSEVKETAVSNTLNNATK